MARTNTERIEDLTRGLTEAKVELVDVREFGEDTRRELRELRREVADLLEQRRVAAEAQNSRLAVVESEVQTLKKSGDEWGKRIWAVLQGLLLLAAGSLITLLVKR